MSFEKVLFHNKNNQELEGRLEFPANRHPHNFVIFAHCFTGNKNFSAVVDISRALIAAGFAVLRFDFTGLGESEGLFENTNFSHNIDDLIAASDFLSKNYEPPTMIIGHSLGGTAAIYASHHLKNIKAVATIASPADPDHIKNLLKNDLEEIEKTGKAVVNIGGRNFTIKKSFLDDLEIEAYDQILEEMHKPILIFHSPQDKIVSVENAEKLYKLAQHPKSFISLEGADHLLTKEKDAKYVGKVCASWAIRYLEIPDKEKLHSKHEVMASLDKEDGFTTKMKLGKHYLSADEPISFGGNDFGPDPYELVSGGLSACTAMTVQMYAKRKKWDLETVDVHVNYGREHNVDCLDCSDKDAKIDTFEIHLKLVGKLDAEQKEKLLNIAKKCPVHKSLTSEIQIRTVLLE
ncbi:MAG TPA: alpha/beta fold hydrolase [Flavobacteriaceae bacterium]|nr:alpha/beta fold hydrolase [Flavobacteriaceae bacterium]